MKPETTNLLGDIDVGQLETNPDLDDKNVADIPQVIDSGRVHTTASFFEWLAGPDGGYCCCVRDIGGGLYAAIKPLLYHWTLIVGEIGDEFAYLDRWCYVDRTKVETAIEAWDGKGEPTGWHRHPYSGRRRDDGDPQKENIAA